jgi:Antitoxin-like ribbon-helix-helix
LKKSSLAAGLKAAAGHHAPAQTPEAPAVMRRKGRGKPIEGRGKATGATVLVGAHYDQEVRRALLLVQAEPQNAGKNLKRLLGEAINDLCAKYGKPQPYAGED